MKTNINLSLGTVVLAIMMVSMLLLLTSACSSSTKKDKVMSSVATSNNPADSPIAITYASKAKAQELLTTEDAYTKAWSTFDIDSKSKKVGTKRGEFLEFIASQALEWSADEKTKISAIIEKIKQSITDQNFKLKLDEPIYLVKTTADEEGGAVGYTRGNYIVLSDKIGDMKDDSAESLVAHELFHVISRNKPALRKKLYSLIGFEMMNEVHYPAAISNYRITNPDATQTDSYINLKVGEQTVPCMMILYANRPYDGGSFFKYLNVGFLRLQGETAMTPVVNDEGPVIYSMKDVTGFFEQVGRNTEYIIHPEEIMADNFTYALLGKEDLKNPELVDNIKAVLKD